MEKLKKNHLIFLSLLLIGSFFLFRYPSYKEIDYEKYKIVYDTYNNETINFETKKLIEDILKDEKIYLTEYNRLTFLHEVIIEKKENKIKEKLLKNINKKYI